MAGLNFHQFLLESCNLPLFRAQIRPPPPLTRRNFRFAAQSNLHPVVRPSYPPSVHPILSLDLALHIVSSDVSDLKPIGRLGEHLGDSRNL